MASYSGQVEGFEFEGAWGQGSGGRCSWSATIYRGDCPIGRVAGDFVQASGHEAQITAAAHYATATAVGLWLEDAADVPLV